MDISKKEFMELVTVLANFDAQWIVSSNPEGCPKEQAKVYLRRKRIKKSTEILRVHLVVSECLPDLEVEKLKELLRLKLKWLEVLM